MLDWQAAAQSAEDDPVWSHCFLSTLGVPAALARPQQPHCSDKRKPVRHMAHAYKELYTGATYVTVRRPGDSGRMLDIPACEHISPMNAFGLLWIYQEAHFVWTHLQGFIKADAGQYLPNSYFWTSLNVGNLTMSRAGSCTWANLATVGFQKHGWKSWQRKFHFIKVNLIYADYVMLNRYAIVLAGRCIKQTENRRTELPPR